MSGFNWGVFWAIIGAVIAIYLGGWLIAAIFFGSVNLLDWWQRKPADPVQTAHEEWVRNKREEHRKNYEACLKKYQELKRQHDADVYPLAGFLFQHRTVMNLKGQTRNSEPPQHSSAVLLTVLLMNERNRDWIQSVFAFPSRLCYPHDEGARPMELSKILGPGQNLEPGHDPANDQMRYSVTREDGGVFEVRITRTARTQAKPSPEQRIKDWFSSHPMPNEGASIRIPDEHFDPRYF